MKKIVFFRLAAILLLSVVFAACTKDDNKISGTITFDQLMGDVRPAIGASVNLVSGSHYVMMTSTDEDGNYSFTEVEDGDYFIQATHVATLLTYTGKSKGFSVKGEDSKTINLELQLQR